VTAAQGSGARAEFDRQVAAYGAGALDAATTVALEALRNLVAARLPADGFGFAENARPFVLVLPARCLPAAESLPRVAVGGRPGFVSADSSDLDTYGAIADVTVPQSAAYVLAAVERGDEYANWSPDEALPAILARARTPLTVAEGIALLTVAPELLERNRCFMLLGSRGRDKRVPALWISGGTGKDGRERRGAPKLGWCWAGNRHTWLGHASAAERFDAAGLSVGVPTMSRQPHREGHP
jgi:hypothetical protein